MYAALRARWLNDYPEQWTDHLVEAAIYNERKTDALSSSITLQDWEHARKRWCTDFRFLDVSADLSGCKMMHQLGPDWMQNDDAINISVVIGQRL